MTEGKASVKKLKRDDALRMVEKQFGEQVGTLLETIEPDSQLRTAIIDALRERLLLAEHALERMSEPIVVVAGAPVLPEVWLAIREHLSRGETAEWIRLNRVVVDLLHRIETQSTAGRP